VAQPVVIHHALMAERDAEDALANQGGDVMLDTLRRPPVPKQAVKRRTRLMARSVAPSSSAPAFEVIAPPSKDATTRRPSTGAKSNSAGLSDWLGFAVDHRCQQFVDLHDTALHDRQLLS
jgi:hypothetical protein